jgi:hypothetical protein
LEDSYGPGSDSFTWKKGNETFWGKFDDVYPGGGYFAYISADPVSRGQSLQYLQDNNWVDSSTRVVVISFTIYNVNLNVFGIARLAIEFPPYGSVTPYVGSLDVVKGLRYILQ